MTDAVLPIPGEDAFGRLTRRAVAAAIGYSVGTLANWAVAGYGPKPRRLPRGNKVYYLASEVRAFALSEAEAA